MDKSNQNFSWCRLPRPCRLILAVSFAPMPVASTGTINEFANNDSTYALWKCRLAYRNCCYWSQLHLEGSSLYPDSFRQFLHLHYITLAISASRALLACWLYHSLPRLWHCLESGLATSFVFVISRVWLLLLFRKHLCLRSRIGDSERLKTPGGFHLSRLMLEMDKSVAFRCLIACLRWDPYRGCLLHLK